MAYSSLLFIYGFFPLSLLIFYAVPKKHSEKALLALSAVYCGITSLYFLIFMALYIFFNYSMCRITQFLKEKESIAEVPLASMIVLDITAIFTFRTPYMEWFGDMLHAPDAFFPIGISFFTLSAIGTLIDVYKGKHKAEKNIVRFSLYIMFFPRLIMGPLLRYSTFCKIMDKQNSGLSSIGKGIGIFVKGLAKKVIVADTLYMLYSAANRADTEKVTALTAFLGVLAYLLCLYFNMSGFADMGCGIAECFGIHFPRSFNYPLFSKKICYFRGRWLTQLNFWFRRYAEKPITFICRKKWLKMTVFAFVSGMVGFWYTFSFNGFTAGFFIGTAMLIESRFANRTTLNFTGIAYTAAASLIWAVFLSTSGLKDAFGCFSELFGRYGLADSLSIYLLRKYIPIIILSLFASTDLFGKLMKKAEKNKHTGKAVLIFTPAVILGLLAVCTVLISADGYSEMIQFRF